MKYGHFKVALHPHLHILDIDTSLQHVSDNMLLFHLKI